MTTAAFAPEYPAALSQPRELRFFAIVATIMALIVLTAFSVQVSMGRSTFASPVRVHVHAIAFMGWVSIFLIQSWFAARGSLAVHRRLGWFAAGWVILMLCAASWVVIAMTRRGTWPFFFKPQQLLVGDPLMLLCFAGLTWWAVSLRRQTDWHARLHISAMTALMGPAFGRLIPMPLLVPYAFEISNLLALMFPVAGMVHDLRRRGSIHPAWVIGFGTVAIALLLVDLIAYSLAGDAFYRVVTAGSPGAAVPGLAYPPPPSGPLLTGR